MIFQEFNLFQHMTVLGNLIEGAVSVKEVPKKQAIAKAEELLAAVGLLAKRDDFPSRLAAGEQQQQHQPDLTNTLFNEGILLAKSPYRYRRRNYQQYVQKAVALGRRPELVGGELVRSPGGWSEVLALRGRGGKQKKEKRYNR
jgi:ABC-type Fe3+/spermidine/putrescine transport system ATPase subunit